MDVWLFPVFAITDSAAGSTLTHVLPTSGYVSGGGDAGSKGVNIRTLMVLINLHFQYGGERRGDTPFTGRGGVSDPDSTFLITRKL